MKLIAAAFVSAQRGFAPALKTSTNPHFRSKYVSLDGCIEAVIDSLNANGIALLQPTHECETGVTVETLFVHESGEVMSGGKLHVPAAKNDPQGYGSALTYARRYSLMAACGIAPEDDDGNAASRAPAPKKDSAAPASFRSSPTMNVLESLPEARQSIIVDVANAIKERFAAGDVVGAYEEYLGLTDVEEKTGLWSLLDSKVRSAIKKHGETLKG